jgi:hypothetical protein
MDFLGEQISFLLDMGTVYSCLLSYVGEHYSQTTIIMGVKGNHRIHKSLPRYHAKLGSQCFYIDRLLIIPECLTLFLG